MSIKAHIPAGCTAMDSPPEAFGWYWLKDAEGASLFAHYGEDHQWSAFDCEGHLFKLTGTYLYWWPDERAPFGQDASYWKKEAARGEADKATLRSALLMDEPWPLQDILSKLAFAAECLLNKYNYDMDGHEEIQITARCAQYIAGNFVPVLAALEPRPAAACEASDTQTPSRNRFRKVVMDVLSHLDNGCSIYPASPLHTKLAETFGSLDASAFTEGSAASSMSVSCLQKVLSKVTQDLTDLRVKATRLEAEKERLENALLTLQDARKHSPEVCEAARNALSATETEELITIRQWSETDAMHAAEVICRIYFEIAAEAIGESEVRRLRDERLDHMVKIARKPLICSKCGADRSKELGCGTSLDCPMTGEASAAPSCQSSVSHMKELR